MERKTTPWTLFIFIAFFSLNRANAQVLPVDDNFDSIYQKQLNYIQELANKQGKEIYDLKEYKYFTLWVNYYQTKVDENNNLKAFGEASKEYFENNTDVIGDFDLDWEYNAPDSLWVNFSGLLSKKPGQGLIISLWIDPNDMDHIMAGGQFSGGLWETKDNGNNWENLTEGYPEIQGISDIFVNPNDSLKIFVTTSYDAESPKGYANGLFYSEDGGSTWLLNVCHTIDTIVSKEGDYYPFGHPTISPRVFLQNPINDSIMYLLTPYRLLVSYDAGQIWNVIINKYDSNFNPGGFYSIWDAKRFFNDMVFDPVDPSTVYVTGPEAFRVEGNGNTVINITDSLLKTSSASIAEVIRVDAVSNFPDSIWFSFIDTLTADVYVGLYNKQKKTYTVKKTFLDDNFGIPTHYLECEVSPKNPDHILIGGFLAYCLDFATDTAEMYHLKRGLHNDIRDTEWPDTGDSTDFVLIGHDGGLTKIYDFSPLAPLDFEYDYIANDGTNGIRNLDVQGFDVSTNGKDMNAIGMSHDGLVLKHEGIWKTPDFTGGDYQSIIFDPTDSKKFYATDYGSPRLWKFDNYGQLDSSFYQYEKYKENFPILFFAPKNPKVIYAGYNEKILEFNSDSLFYFVTPETHYFDTDTFGYQYIKEVGISNELDSLFFISTNRYWRDWLGWDSTVNSNPHTNALFKVEMMGDSLVFNDISENLDNGLYGGPITGLTIAVNDNDTIVYACFGNTSFAWPPNPEMKKKVYYSNDLGITWHAMADGLNERIPVNDIRFDPISGLVFLVSDVGVYYYDNQDSIWKDLTGNLPPMSYSSIRFSLNKHKIFVGSHAKGVWQADIPCLNNAPDLVITTDTSWEQSMPLHGNLIIETGVTMTITNTVYVPTLSKIIVKPGGHLILDGGTLTNACGGLWQGVEVQGTATASQNPTDQGWVEILNGGTIKNAEIGIQTIKMSNIPPPGDAIPDYTYTGGIVQCSDANFLNNKVAVQFFDYSFPSVSNFSGCHFITNDNYFGDGNPDYFLKMSSIHGINYSNCSFENNSSNSYFGSGIRSFNAGFKVEGKCLSSVNPCPDSLWEYSEFNKLKYGIYATSGGAVYFPDIGHTNFTQNNKGVYFSGMENGSIAYCNFTTGPNSGSSSYGLYLDFSTAYTVEDNNFYQGSGNGIGLVVNKSGSSPNMIYRNYFEGLHFAILAQNNNRAVDGSGLVLKCNQYVNNERDQLVLWDGQFMDKTAGIAENQGADLAKPNAPAGNRFSHTGPIGTPTDIYNEANDITYYYHVAEPFWHLEPKYYTEETVHPEAVEGADWIPEESCPPSDGGGGGIGNTEEMKSAMATSGQKADSVQNIINILKDGGSTEDMKWEVDLSTPPETYSVYNELMNNSPYISDTVMEAAIEKEDVLPNVMIRDVMVANPHNAKDYALMEKIDERTDPMPAYMKAQILQGGSLVSVFENLQSQLAFYKQQRTIALNALIKYYIADTLSPATSSDSLIVLLEYENNLSAKYSLAFLYYEKGAWNTGQNILSNIPQQFNLTEEELEMHEQLVNYYTLLVDLAQNGKTFAETDSSQIETLFEIEELQAGRPSVYARNILLDLDKINYDEPILTPDYLKSAAVHQQYNELKQALNEHFFLKIFPNPAGDYLIIEHKLEMEPENAYVKIRDTKGKIVKQTEVTGKQNQQTLDIKDLNPGVYIATLYVNNKELESVKFSKVN